jgi:hypothetical protein
MEIKIATIGSNGTNWSDPNCATCGMTYQHGEHTGHHGHFTGAWICHDCGPVCYGFDD